MKRRFAGVIALTWLTAVQLFAQGADPVPVTPDASPEATALLHYINSISGKYILSGQHNFPISGDRNSQFAADYIGETPVVWSQDFGFSEDGDKDSYLARPSIIQEAIRQHQLGAIITLCWHAVPPTANEPITFQPLPGADSTALASVQGSLLDEQFRDVLTPGTDLHERWLAQVDEIAFFLKELRDAGVPVLWRPYHEMNGDWFWWGGRHEGQYTTKALYRQIFDRMANLHKLNNLIWVWSVDRPSEPGREFEKYYPGTEYLDMLSLDVYGNDFDQSYYDGLMALSEGKPLALGEVGNPPSLEIIEAQPNWMYWVVWSGMVRGTSRGDYEKLANDSRVLFMEDPAYISGTVAFRKASGFEPLVTNRTADFTGEWLLSESESMVQGAGPGGTPYKINVIQKDDELTISSATIVEWADDDVTEETLLTDGSENVSTGFNNSPRIQIATWSAERDTLTIESTLTFNFGGRSMEISSKDEWMLKRRGKQLVITRTASSFRGPTESTLVYNKR